jgi:hypothetical protein
MTITGYKKLGSSWSTWSAVDEDEVKEFLYETGPLAIALNADPLQTYTSGVLDLTSTKCPSSGINHAVTLVGYGTDSATGLDYWIVKNSCKILRNVTIPEPFGKGEYGPASTDTQPINLKHCGKDATKTHSRRKKL